MMIAAAGGSCAEIGTSMEDLRAFAFVELAERMPAVVLIGLEPGWDHALGFAALDAGLNLHVIIPYRDWPSKWSVGIQKKCEKLIEGCHVLTYMGDSRDESTSDIHIVSIADTVLTLYPPGMKPHEIGGRIRSAEIQKKKLVDLWPSWLESRD